MTKTLRRRMALIAMASLLTILTIIVVLINVINFAGVRSDADDIVALLVKNGGQFVSPQPPSGGAEGGFEDEESSRPTISPEAPYETRFFMALIDDETLRVVKLNTSQIAALSEDEAMAYLNRIYFGRYNKGFLGNYRFARAQTEEGTLIVVVDWSKQLNAAKSFLLSSVIISVAGAGIVFFLVMWLSKLAVKPIEENNARQKRFITDSSHELKTPLAIISANAELLEMEYGENEWVRSILNQVERLTSLTSRLTQLARMGEDEMVAEMERIDLTELVGEAVGSFATLATHNGKAFTDHTTEGLFVRGQREGVAQMLSILLDNSVKYAKTFIDVRLERRGNRVAFVVKNDVTTPLEVGMQERFFDRFWRGDQSRSSETPGFGIGLSLARTIADKHGGTLTAESPDGETVVMTLLLRHVD